jgi:polar amino acid transport system permease protein
MLDYTFQYGQIWPYLPRLIDGAYLALEIAFLSFCGGLLIGTVNASLLSFGPKWVSKPILAFVVFFTNTPQLVQIYFLYFALPDSGVLLSSYAAVLIGMTLNAGAYLTEIQRAGFSTRRQSEIEAAIVLGFSRWQQIRYVILPHIARFLFPPLSNHYIIMTLSTSMAAVFGVEELTGQALNINSITFRSLEIFSVVAALYIAITLLASLALGLLGSLLFRTKLRVI